MFGVLLHRGGQLLHRGRGLFQARRLLLGATRQVVVAGGDFGGSGIDADRRGLDAADDAGQLVGGGVGVVAHGGEYAVELAVHARGEVACGDGLQQRRQLAEVAVADLHHRVEVLHHQPEVVLEMRGIAAGAEVAGRGGGGQALDLGIDRQQAGLGRIHRLVQHRTTAGQAPGVAAQVAVGVFVEHADGIDDGVQVLEHHGIDALAQLAVDAREVLRHAVGHVLVGMQFDHQRGFAGEALQLGLHAAHRDQQTAGFVARVGAHVVVQAAVGDGFGGAGGAAQRPGEAAGDRPAQQAADQQDRKAAGDEDDAAPRHRCRGDSIGLPAQAPLQIGIGADRRLLLLHRHRGIAQQQCLCLGVQVLLAQRQHLVVELHRLRARILDRGHGLAFGRGCRHRRQCILRRLVARPVALHDVDHLLVGRIAIHDGDGQQSDLHIGVGVQHLVGEADLFHVAVDDAVQFAMRPGHGQQPHGDQYTGQQDEDAERHAQAPTDVVALQKCVHSRPLGDRRSRVARAGRPALRRLVAMRCHPMDIDMAARN
ncbi:hypothetical protein NB689_002988 [Xanthomonas sacchari]|nr:hypothetical protein [Xanthomonas sacchari]